MASEVPWINDQSASRDTRLVSWAFEVFDAAGCGRIIQRGDVVAVKFHAGEYDEIAAYLHSVNALVKVERDEGLGGRYS